MWVLLSNTTNVLHTGFFTCRKCTWRTVQQVYDTHQTTTEHQQRLCHLFPHTSLVMGSNISGASSCHMLRMFCHLWYKPISCSCCLQVSTSGESGLSAISFLSVLFSCSTFPECSASSDSRALWRQLFTNQDNKKDFFWYVDCLWRQSGISVFI